MSEDPRSPDAEQPATQAPAEIAVQILKETLPIFEKEIGRKVTKAEEALLFMAMTASFGYTKGAVMGLFEDLSEKLSSRRASSSSSPPSEESGTSGPREMTAEEAP